MKGCFGAALLACGLVLALACSGDGKQAAGQAAGLRLLVAGETGLSELEGGRLRKLVTFPDGSFILDPVASPDNARLAFIRQPPSSVSPGGSVDFGSDLYVSRRDGSDARLLLKHSVPAEFLRTPAWLTDGRILVTVRGRDERGAAALSIDAVDALSGQRTRWADNAIDPALSPDGRGVLFSTVDPETRFEQVVVADAIDGGNRRALAGTGQGLSLISSAVWSPDGARIAFAAVDLNAPVIVETPSSLPTTTGRYVHPFAQDIWVINSDGSGLRRLAELTDNQPSIDWSDDGKSIYSLGVTGFWRVDAASGEREAVDVALPLGHIRRVGDK